MYLQVKIYEIHSNHKSKAKDTKKKKKERKPSILLKKKKSSNTVGETKGRNEQKTKTKQLENK